jgi:NAD(P)-dependent dehydrogenase (short-subunit alcohol dehydrogenase family)
MERVQRVLVTAGAAGIGREIVRAFYRGGAAVYTCDVDGPGLAALADELPGLHTSVCDVADRSAVGAMVEDAAARLGGIDVLVNNAGIGGPTAPVESFDPEAWDRVLRVNLTGTFDVTRHAIPHVKRSEAGVIVIMSSAAGRLGYANRSAYCASKWALVGLAKTLSIELGEHGIRVNAVLPGAVDGPRMQQVIEGRARISGKPVAQVQAEAMTNSSIRKPVDPRDVASLCVYLASDAAKSITGQALPIDNDLQKSS